MGERVWEWTLVFMNDVQGFRKTITVEAASYGLAVTFGLDKLGEAGYEHQQFELVELKRGRII